MQTCWKLDVKHDCTKKWKKDARTWIHDSMFRAVFMGTYNTFQAMKGLGSDCYRFRGLQARTPR